MAEHLTVTRHGTVSLLAIDDGKVNALSKDLIAAISAAIDAAEADPTTTAIVIAGREGRFSGGFDLGVMMSGDAAAAVDLVADGGDLVRRVYASTVPVVAACTGHAMAAGALLLLGCDIRVGAQGPYRIGLNEVAIGMVLPAWAVTIASVRLAATHLQRSIFTARVTDADGAVAAGFLDSATALEDVVASALAEADQLSNLDRSAYAESVRRYRSPTLDLMATQIAEDRASVE